MSALFGDRPDLCCNFIIDDKKHPDDPDVKLTLKEVSRKLGTTYIIVYGWFHDLEYTTMKECRERQAFLKKYPSGKVPESFDTCKGKMTMTDIIGWLDKHENFLTKPYTVKKRMKKYGEGSKAVFFGKCNRIEFYNLCIKYDIRPLHNHCSNRMDKSKDESVELFDRSVCMRKLGIFSFVDTCDNYSECSSHRLEKGKHHPRYKIDNSCYICTK